MYRWTADIGHAAVTVVAAAAVMVDRGFGAAEGLVCVAVVVSGHQSAAAVCLFAVAQQAVWVVGPPFPS